MKKFITSVSILIAGVLTLSAQQTITSTDIETIQNANWNWTPAGTNAKGKAYAEAGYAQVNVFGGIQSISVVRYPAKRYKTDIFTSNGKDADVTSALAKKAGATIAINASYFSGELGPVTYVKDEGIECGYAKEIEHYRMRGMLMFSKNGKKMDIATVEPEDYTKATSKYPEAIISGPILMENGKIINYEGKIEKSAWDSFYGVRHPRTIMGYDKKGWFYMIVIDGRSVGNADGTTIAETAAVAKAFGLYEAINLDGGGSSTIWTAETGVINNPCDNKTFDHNGERRVPNIIVAR